MVLPHVMPVDDNDNDNDNAVPFTVTDPLPYASNSSRNPFPPLGRHPTLGLLHSFGDQLDHRIVVVDPLGPRRCVIAGFELVDDPFDGLGGGVAHLGGGSV